MNQSTAVATTDIPVTDPPSRPTAPPRPDRASRTIVSFDWQLFATDTVLHNVSHRDQFFEDETD
jgi:hypothetical protein